MSCQNYIDVFAYHNSNIIVILYLPVVMHMLPVQFLYYEIMYCIHVKNNGNNQLLYTLIILFRERYIP